MENKRYKTYDCTGHLFPWVYRRELIQGNKIELDCLSPLEQLCEGDTMIILMPFEYKKSIYGHISKIISQTDTPQKMFDPNLEKNSYYKIVLTINSNLDYERTSF
jgi:hypothetical protein